VRTFPLCLAPLALLVPLALGCEEPLLAPPLSPSAPAAPVIAEASVALAPAEGARSAPGVPPELRASPPTLADLLASLRSSELRGVLGEAVGQPVVEAPAAGLSVEAVDEGRAAKLVVRAPDRATAMFTCRSYAALAVEHAQRLGADPAEGWLLGEIARLEQEVAALDRQLSLLPTTPWGLPRSRDEALTLARVRRLEAKAELRAQGELPSATFPIARALGSLAREARAEEQEARAQGRGAEHPEVRALAARAEAYARQLAASWGAEEEGVQRVAEALLALPARADRRAVLKALAAQLRGRSIEQACSLDPTSLQVLALMQARLRAAEAELAVQYGAKHPRRLVITEQIDALSAAYRAERDTVAALIEREGAADLVDARRYDLRDRAVLLTATLARLVRHRETARPARWVIAAPCRLR
jgi:hypothetical protein